MCLAMGMLGGEMTAAEAPAGARALPREPVPVFKALQLQKNEQPPFVSALAVNARITGNLAETTLELTLHNPNARILEGECTLPLPDGATVSGMALDINGQMVDASVVEKSRARQVFEDVAREGVDPALTEHVGGNNYRTRVYPLPARGDRRLRLKYLSPLADDDGSPLYVLPMRYPEKLNCKLRVEVIDPGAAPRVRGGGFANLRFQNWEKILVAEQSLEDLALTEDLRISVAKVENPPVFVEKAADGVYFTAEVRVPETAETAAAPAGVDLVWDASLSRKDQDHAAETAFLRQWFADRKAGALPVTLFFLRNTLEKAGEFTVRDGDVTELLDKLKNTVYDGGTNFSALAGLPARAENFPALLFSDGMHNFGEKLASPARKGLTAVTVASGADTAYLRFLAEKSGGRFVNLTLAAPAAAAEQARAPLAAFLGASVPDVYAVRLAPGRWQVAGRAPAEKGTVKLSFTGGTAEVTVDPDGARAGTLLRTFYALRLLAEKSGNPLTAKEEFLALGQRYGLVTPGASLLVLDSLDQYRRYRVRPPDSLPEWQRQYDIAVNGEEKDKEKTKGDLIASAAKRYQTEVMERWYGKEFSAPPPVPLTKKIANALGGMLEDRIVGAFSRENGRTVASADGRARRTVEAETVEEEAAGGEDTVDFAESVDAEAPESAVTMGLAAARAPAAKARVAGEPSVKVKINAWNPETPYLAAMKAAPEKAEALYLEYRDKNAANVGFYTDCADYFLQKGEKALGLRILSNLAELGLENRAVLRVLGYKLRYGGELRDAETVFRKVLELAPDEAQSYRDLALTLDDAEKFADAAAMMMNLVTRRYDRRFPGIELIGITELNRILNRAARAGKPVGGIDKRLVFPVETDIRVVLNWDADNTDMDLHTVDPFGVDCFYGKRYTHTGGYNSYDFVQGYGPEEFRMRKAFAGEYRVFAHYYGARAQTVLGAVTLYAEIYSDYGRAEEKRQTISFRLNGRNDNVDIVKFTKEAPKAEGKPATGADPAPAAPGQGSRQYQVKANETLEDIARRELGDADRAAEIRRLNPELPDAVRPGTIIRLP